MLALSVVVHDFLNHSKFERKRLFLIGAFQKPETADFGSYSALHGINRPPVLCANEKVWAFCLNFFH